MADSRGIPDALETLLLPDEKIQDLADAAEGDERRTLTKDQIEDLALLLLRREAPDVREGFLEGPHGLDVGVSPRCLPGEPGEVLDSLGDLLGPRVVVCEALVAILQAIRVEVGPALALVTSVRASFVRARDGAEMYTYTFDYRSERRKLSEWAADNARLFREEWERARDSLADRIVGGLFPAEAPRESEIEPTTNFSRSDPAVREADRQ